MIPLDGLCWSHGLITVGFSGGWWTRDDSDVAAVLAATCISFGLGRSVIDVHVRLLQDLLAPYGRVLWHRLNRV